MASKFKPEERREYTDLNFLISKAAASYADKPYVVSLVDGKSISFRALKDGSNMVANFLVTEGIEEGDVVTVIGRNTIQTLLVYFGILTRGAIANPIFFEESRENIHRILRKIKPKAIFVENEPGLEDIEFPAKLFYFSGTEKSGDVFRKIYACPTEFKHGEIKPEAGALILVTSGTTELPKAVYITREQLFYMVDEVSDRIQLTEHDRVLEYRAFNWASVQLLTIWSCVVKGATLFLATKFSRSNFPRWLKDNRITISVGVPTSISILLNEPVSIHKSELPFLRFMTSSSAPLSVENQMQFERLYGIPVVQMMGMTEAGWVAGNPVYAPKTGSVGVPMKYKEVFFVNEKGEVCKPGETGEMLIKGRSLGLGYLADGGGIIEFPKEGFPSGDLGYMDDDGYIYITGRKKDIIIRGGINISPAEIDSWLAEHPAVRDVATIGVPDKIYGEEVVSFVVLRPDSKVTESELKSHCLERFPEFKAPKKIIFLEYVPRNPNGKVIKRELLSMYHRLTDTGNL